MIIRDLYVSQPELDEVFDAYKGLLVRYIKTMLNSGLACCFASYDTWCLGLSYLEPQGWHAVSGNHKSVLALLNVLSITSYAKASSYDYSDYLVHADVTIPHSPSHLHGFKAYLDSHWIVETSVSRSYDLFLSSVLKESKLLDLMLEVKSIVKLIKK